MSTIQVKCLDQVLTVTNSPVIASGGVNEDYIEFDFCPLWSGYGKTAIFYKNEDEIYYSILVDDTCLIPHEVLTEKGKFYFAVFGTSEDITRTSNTLCYSIEKGALTENLIEPDEPSQTIYEQILAAYGRLDTDVTSAVGQISTMQSNLNAHLNNTGIHVTSAEKTNWNSKQDELTFDNTPTTGSNNPVKSGGIKTALDGKQNTLTFDNTPTAGSNNPVKSSGIKTALDGKAASSHTHTIAQITDILSGTTLPQTVTNGAIFILYED